MSPESSPQSARVRDLDIAVWMAPLAAFLVVLYAAGIYGSFPGDVSVSGWVQSTRTAWLDGAMVAFSPVPRMLAPWLAVLVPAALAFRGPRSDAAVVFLAMMASFATLTVAKALVARPRPAADLVEVIKLRDGYSFPSGHILHYTVLVGLLAVLLSSRISSRPTRLAAYGAGIASLLALGFMRVYLGVHWVSDVLAGYATGAAIVCGAIWLRPRVDPLVARAGILFRA